MPLIAHYGGIDEIGVFVIPVLLALWALRWADRRARRAEAESEKDETNPDGPGLYSGPDE